MSVRSIVGVDPTAVTVQADTVSLSVRPVVDTDQITVASDIDSLRVERAISAADPTAAKTIEAKKVFTIGATKVEKPTAVEVAAGRVGLHLGAESVANPEETNDARVKNVRKAESMGTTTAEPLAAPEKKIRYTEDDALLVESEAERKSHAKRSEEARARKRAKNTQRQRARKASISGRQNMAKPDGAQEAEETDGSGKCGNSSEHSHGPTKL